jgi:topoisomerase-4 subunit A
MNHMPYGNILDARFVDEMTNRYISYALSATMSRALPDVRDGLKPVHRRILFAMMQLKLNPGAGFKKSARVVGDVMGKFHPHGDAAIYEAMVRLSQDFASRYPLVDGQGNFGNIDGDNAAAMRYTESRLTEFASAMLDGIDDQAIPFRPTYDNIDEEPIVLPAAVPNLLANGSTGIAVGMATNIAPHNVAELCSAALALIQNPDLTTAEILNYVPGPDFPTGGVILRDDEAMVALYERGRGSFKLRASWHVEQLKGGTWQVVVTEIPYQVGKASMISAIADMIIEKKLVLVDDIRDESSDVLRIVIAPKNRSVDPAVMMASLFKHSALEIGFHANMNVINAAGVPETMGIKSILRAWLDHRQSVLINRSKYRLALVARRLEILSGYLIVFDALDQVIQIIRDDENPRDTLIVRFGLTELQVDSILDMRLRSLRRLDEQALRKEHDGLTVDHHDLENLLKSEALQWAAISKEIEATQNKFTDPRRTKFEKPGIEQDIPLDAAIEKEPITIILSALGWIRALKGHIEIDDTIKFKDGDMLGFFAHCQTTDRILIASRGGKFFTIAAANISRGRGDGQALRLMIDLGQDDSPVMMDTYKDGDKYLLTRKDGRGFIVESSSILSEKRTGRQVMNTEPGAPMTQCLKVTGDAIAMLGSGGKFLVIPTSSVPIIQKGAGVTLQKYKDGHLRYAWILNVEQGIMLKNGDKSVQIPVADWQAGRATQGKAAPPAISKLKLIA